MKTELGEIKILINGKESDYMVEELKNCCHHFWVKHRFKIVCEIPPQLTKDISIKCIIISDGNFKFEPYVETGENLALVSFYNENMKLSIGTKGDLTGVQYIYPNNGLELLLSKNMEDVCFYIAWLEMKNIEKEDIYTWFAADPAFDI